MTNRIEHSQPTLGPADQAAVSEVVASGRLVGGRHVTMFERSLADAVGMEHAVALTSGSAALHLALAALDLPAGSVVAIPSYTCISVLQAVRRAGLMPLIIDVDPGTYLMDPDDLESARTPSTRAVILVHSFGLPASHSTYNFEGLKVVDDIACALGSEIDGRQAGTEGNAAVCSFHATKMITTGMGGAVLSNEPGIRDLILDRTDYDARGDDTVRFNERMPAISAALGLSQLDRLDRMLEARRRLAAVYDEELSGTPVMLPPRSSATDPCWHRYVARIPGGADLPRRYLAERGIVSPPPVHIPLHRITGDRKCPGAEATHHESLSLPIYPSLAVDDARLIATEVKACL